MGRHHARRPSRFLPGDHPIRKSVVQVGGFAAGLVLCCYIASSRTSDEQPRLAALDKPRPPRIEPIPLAPLPPAVRQALVRPRLTMVADTAPLPRHLTAPVAQSPEPAGRHDSDSVAESSGTGRHRAEEHSESVRHERSRRWSGNVGGIGHDADRGGNKWGHHLPHRGGEGTGPRDDDSDHHQGHDHDWSSDYGSGGHDSGDHDSDSGSDHGSSSDHDSNSSDSDSSDSNGGSDD